MPDGDSKSRSGFARSVATRRADQALLFRGWVLFILSGMFAIIEPVFAGLGVTLLVAWLLSFGGLRKNRAPIRSNLDKLSSQFNIAKSSI